MMTFKSATILTALIVHVNASSLPSNALNRWSANSMMRRGGETSTAVTSRSQSQSRNSSSSSTMRMENMNTNAGTGANAGTNRPKKRRKKKSATGASTANTNTQSSQSQSQSSPKRSTKRSPIASPTGKAQSSTSTATSTRKKQSTTIPQTVTPIIPITQKQSPQKQLQAQSPSLPSSTSSSSSSSTSTPSHDQMPSIFQPEESIYDKYAACLAATEGLRRIRDSKVPKSSSSSNRFGPFGGGSSGSSSVVDADSSNWKSMLRSGTDGISFGKGTNGVGSTGTSTTGSTDSVGATAAAPTSIEQQKEEYKRACAEYVLNSSKVIKALGLSVSQYNQLGREIKKDGALKEKVLEQAYLYRLASTIKMDKIPLIQDPNSKKLLQSHKRRRVQMFVRSITEIEELRSEQMERLRRALKIDKLPANMNLCDPNVLPLLNPKVRAVVEAFPLQAEVIVKKYGLNSDEFNSMLEETRGNPIFRWRVQRFKKKDDSK